jgi:hypothetical protein
MTSDRRVIQSLGQPMVVGRIFMGSAISSPFTISALIAMSFTIATAAAANPPIDIEPKLLESSPTLQKWLRQIPDVRRDIQNEPAFRTRLQIGYRSPHKSDRDAGWQLGLEDLRLGKTNMTLSSYYRSSFNGRDRAFGADIHTNLNGLGEPIQLAPTIGWRHIRHRDNATSGVNLGLRTRFNLARGGATDITIDQSWVAPGSDHEIGLTTIAFGYALTPNVRLNTQWQHQQSNVWRDRNWSIGMEWQP